MRLLLVLSIAAVTSLPAWSEPQPPKSACTERNHGKLWPPEANGNRTITQRQFSAGELWMCEGNYDWDAYFPATLHFFTWKRLSVRWKSKAARGDGTVQAEDSAAEGWQ